MKKSKLKTIKITIMVNEEEHVFLKANAERYFDGNISMVLRKGGIVYTQGADPCIIIGMAKKSK